MPSFNQGQGQQSTAIVPGMKDVYGQLLGLNQQNYQNILQSYTQGQQNLQGQLGSINQGYGQLTGDVLGTLGVKGGGWGVAAPAAQAIGQAFAQSQGASRQQLINAGLGNTTVQANLSNQNSLYAGQAYGALGAQLAQTAAGYQAQLGQAGLSQRMAGLGMQTNLANSLMGHLAGYHFANTAGGLTGGFGSSHNQGGGVESPGFGGRGGGAFGPGMETSVGGWGGFVPQGLSVYGGANPGAGAAIPTWLGGAGSGGGGGVAGGSFDGTDGSVFGGDYGGTGTADDGSLGLAE